MIKWLAKRMRYAADRLDYQGAPRTIGYSFTFEPGKGIVFHEDGYLGCRLWYMGEEDYKKAYRGCE